MRYFKLDLRLDFFLRELKYRFTEFTDKSLRIRRIFNSNNFLSKLIKYKNDPLYFEMLEYCAITFRNFHVIDKLIKITSIPNPYHALLWTKFGWRIERILYPNAFERKYYTKLIKLLLFTDIQIIDHIKIKNKTLSCINKQKPFRYFKLNNTRLTKLYVGNFEEFVLKYKNIKKNLNRSVCILNFNEIIFKLIYTYINKIIITNSSYKIRSKYYERYRFLMEIHNLNLTRISSLPYIIKFSKTNNINFICLTIDKLFSYQLRLKDMNSAIINTLYSNMRYLSILIEKEYQHNFKILHIIQKYKSLDDIHNNAFQIMVEKGLIIFTNDSKKLISEKRRDKVNNTLIILLHNFGVLFTLYIRYVNSFTTSLKEKVSEKIDNMIIFNELIDDFSNTLKYSNFSESKKIFNYLL